MSAVENLAKETCIIALKTIGHTRGMAEQAWNNDIEARKHFIIFAEHHAARIITEAIQRGLVQVGPARTERKNR